MFIIHYFLSNFYNVIQNRGAQYAKNKNGIHCRVQLLTQSIFEVLKYFLHPYEQKQC